MKKILALATITSGLALIACANMNKNRIPASEYNSQNAEMYAGTTLKMTKGTLAFVNNTGAPQSVEKSCQFSYNNGTVTCAMSTEVPAHSVYTLSGDQTLTVDKHRSNHAVFFYSNSGRRIFLYCEHPTSNGRAERIPVNPILANSCFKDNFGQDNEITFTNPSLKVEPIRYEVPAQDNSPIEI